MSEYAIAYKITKTQWLAAHELEAEQSKDATPPMCISSQGILYNSVDDCAAWAAKNIEPINHRELA